ncbi:hypothetical protein L596_000019 [Steinernema carpocapsae]|uniref:Uncharacterized protein n=1 Tax=Steinernema carpocapsae TaxID=34508 RepID=A0A4U8UGW2_STECR|nr:hypothetical protein L596_000019 [Steinernema carpocapsae]
MQLAKGVVLVVLVAPLVVCALAHQRTDASVSNRFTSADADGREATRDPVGVKMLRGQTNGCDFSKVSYFIM